MLFSPCKMLSCLWGLSSRPSYYEADVLPTVSTRQLTGSVLFSQRFCSYFDDFSQQCKIHFLCYLLDPVGWKFCFGQWPNEGSVKGCHILFLQWFPGRQRWCWCQCVQGTWGFGVPLRRGLGFRGRGREGRLLGTGPITLYYMLPCILMMTLSPVFPNEGDVKSIERWVAPSMAKNRMESETSECSACVRLSGNSDNFVPATFVCLGPDVNSSSNWSWPKKFGSCCHWALSWKCGCQDPWGLRGHPQGWAKERIGREQSNARGSTCVFLWLFKWEFDFWWFVAVVTCAPDEMFCAAASIHSPRKLFYFVNRSQVMISVPCLGSPLVFEWNQPVIWDYLLSCYYLLG